MGKTFTDPDNGRFLRPDEIDTTSSEPYITVSGLTPNISFEKMSKSKHNGVDPGATIAEYGADATRAHMLFQAPVGDVLEWDPTKIVGVQRWLQRILRLSTAFWLPDIDFKKFEIPSKLDVKLLDILRPPGIQADREAQQSFVGPHSGGSLCRPPARRDSIMDQNAANHGQCHPIVLANLLAEHGGERSDDAD